MVSRRRVVLWTFLAILAGVVRFWNLGAHGLTCDELLSLTDATGGSMVTPIGPDASTFTADDFWRGNTLGGLREAVERQDGGNGVLHAVALHSWVGLFGTADASARALSVLFGVALVLLAYAFASSLLSERVALVAAVMLSLHPMLVRYSREARGYALATLLALGATYVFVRLALAPATVPPRGFRAVAYGLLAGAAILSHYLVVAVFAGHLAFALARVREGRVWKRLIVGWVVAALMVATWMASGGAEGMRRMSARNAMFRQRVEQKTARHERPSTIGNVSHDLVVVAQQLTGNAVDPDAPISRAETLLLLAPCVLLAAALLQAPAATSPVILLATLAVAAPVQAIVLALLAGHTTSLIPRYSVFSEPYLLLLMAAGASAIRQVRGPWRAAPVAAVIVLGVLWARSLSRVWSDAPIFRPPNAYAEGAARVASIASPGDVIVHPHWQSARLCALYLPRGAAFTQRVKRQDAAAPLRVLREGRAVLELDVPRACPKNAFGEPVEQPPDRP